MRNLLLMTDSYKVTHWRQYPPGTQHVFSYYESRGGEYPDTTFFGLQYIIQKYLVGQVVTQEKIDEAAAFFEMHFGDDSLFNRLGWEHILTKHDGHLPIRIRAVPEGTRIPNKNVLMTVENTDPAVPWLTNYLETLLCQVWYPTTVCTHSRAMRDTIMEALVKTGTPDLIDYKLHDFGFRGSTSVESAGIGGAAHLVNFQGTDNLAGIETAHYYYDEMMAGYSVPAAEHSTITSWGVTREVDAYRNMLEQFPTGTIAVVSDSYDISKACRDIWGDKLRNAVEERDGVLVIRPDSGYPPMIVNNVLGDLGGAFGYEENDKGYRVLNPKIRVIQGDGIDPHMVSEILADMIENQWSADNITFGSGGGLLQRVDRDTQQFAFKCSAVNIAGKWKDVFKSPTTDPGKASKSGRIELFQTPEGQFLTRVDHIPSPLARVLQTVFADGVLLKYTSFATIRKRVRNEPCNDSS